MPIPVRRSARWSSALLALGAYVLGSPLAADDRSTELMRYQCSSSLGRRDVTLFANGTVRMRQGPWDEQALYLDELLLEELASYVKQLRVLQNSDVDSSVDLPANSPSGDWVEHCEIQLALPGAQPVSYAFSALDIPPLVVAGLIHVAEDLADFTRPPDRVERLPKGYRPRPMDVLRTAAGARFRVVGLTGDARAVELEELDSPVLIYLSIEDLGEMFSALEEPAGR